jgi:hypothetical protein
MSIATDDERAAFEAWAKTRNMDLTPFGTTFDSDFTSNAWDGWQARAALASPSGKQEAFGWVPPRGGNYFTRNETIAKRIGGLVPVYLDKATEPTLTAASRLTLANLASHLEAGSSAIYSNGASGTYAKALRALLDAI